MAVMVWTCVFLVFSHLVVPQTSSPITTSTDPSGGKTCPLPQKKDKATYDGTKHTYKPGETLSYSCNVGFRLQDNSSILRCKSNGQWKPSDVKCQPIKCERFTIGNGKINSGRLRFNTTVSISCNDGYRLRGPSVVTCGANSSWTPALPTCEEELVRVTCPPPAVPNSSGQDGYKIEYEVGEHATISCKEGFELIGSPQVITCGADGQWLGRPECRFTGGKCQPPPYFPHAHTELINLRHYEPNTAVRFRCNHGYRMVRGPSTIYCRNGQWTELEMICEKRKCGSAGEIINGRYHYTGSLFGDTATASCDEGYHLVGVAERHCRAYGWDGRVAVCEAIQCPEPPMVPHADLFFDTNGIIKYGYVASYRCHFGTLIGDSDIICTEDGTWSAPAPRCEVATCPVPIIRNALIVSGMRLRYQSGNSVIFRCRPGRRLSGPDTITCGKDGHWKPRLPQCVFWY